MICVSIGEKSVEACISALEGVEFAEVRLDMVEGIGAGGVKGIFSQGSMGKRLIATLRGEHPKKKELLTAAIEAGAAYVDLDVGEEEGLRKAVIAKAREGGCKVIISFHDFEGTPGKKELEEVVEKCSGLGADVVKVACMVRSGKEAARLLGLLGERERLVVIGMGGKGRIVRVLAPLLGAEFTFASLREGAETAPGQMGKDEMEGLIRLLEEKTREKD